MQNVESEVEDLCLDFSLKISKDSKAVLLKPKGDEQPVTLGTLREYVEAVVKYYLSEGVCDRLKALRKGFNQVFPLQNISIFSEDELQHLIGGSPETPWDLPSTFLFIFIYLLLFSVNGKYSM